MSPEPSNKLLVIDDQPDLCEFISEAAAGLGFESKGVTEPDAFRRAVQEFQPTVVVLDLQMPGADGIELLRYLGERGSKAQILVASGMDQRVLATAQQIGKAHGLQMLGALQKPILLADLEATLRRTLRGDTPVTPSALAAQSWPSQFISTKRSRRCFDATALHEMFMWINVPFFLRHTVSLTAAPDSSASCRLRPI